MKLGEESLDTLFRHARSYNRWSNDAIDEGTLRSLYDLLKMAPTAANAAPARFVFVTSAAAKSKLLSCVSSGNEVKVRQAPVTVIVAMDEKFADKLPVLFAHAPDARTWFDDPVAAHVSAFRNSSLQGAYLIMAARALGLDCGPMSGFDNDNLDREFFSGTNVKSNFICALGRGTDEQLFPRLPRLSFADACEIL